MTPSPQSESVIPDQCVDLAPPADLEKSKDVKDDTVSFEEDPWQVAFNSELGTPWSELSGSQKILRLVLIVVKMGLVLGLLYCFVIALGLLSDAFKILGSKTAGSAFRESDIFDNPFAGLMLGVLVTVLVQSSSTSTSILISMRGANLLTLRQAVPMIMGANIGTTVTNTIVSLGHAGDVNEFRRAFAGATVHDMFNFLNVLVLLPIQAATNFLGVMCQAMVDSMHITDDSQANDIDFLNKITKPVADKIVSVNKKLITKIAQAEDSETAAALRKECMVKDSIWCDWAGECIKSLEDACENDPACDPETYEPTCSKTDDTTQGVLTLILALIMLTLSLVGLVKVLQSLLKGRIAHYTRVLLNVDFPYPFGWVHGYVLMLFGMGATILVQSSSVFTSSFVPFVAIGILTLEKMYPMTLGANIGTTMTGILAALSQEDAESIAHALTLSLTHLFFNIFGVCIWYVVPVMRRVPIRAARAMGNVTAKYRWFPIFYILVCFLIIPAALFGLSMAGWEVFAGVMVPIVLLLLACIGAHHGRKHHYDRMPGFLQDLSWNPLRNIVEDSVEAIDRLNSKCGCVKSGSTDSEEEEEQQDDQIHI
eukprot:Clim_evm2s95 gene=Clim_evmTU2s95